MAADYTSLAYADLTAYVVLVFDMRCSIDNVVTYWTRVDRVLNDIPSKS